MDAPHSFCPTCAREMTEPAAGEAHAPFCPVCRREATPSPAHSDAAAAVATAETSGRATTVCQYCLSPIAAAESAASCPACRTSYHEECWQENGGCAVYGCSQVPTVEARHALEVPVSYWGQENKPCPSCSQQILAAAMRCRHCGATFASARPEDQLAYQDRTDVESRLPETRQRIIWIFILSVVPFAAPVGLVWGFIWRRSHTKEIRALPAMFEALSRIGLIVALVLTILLAGLTSLYYVRQG